MKLPETPTLAVDELHLWWGRCDGVPESSEPAGDPRAGLAAHPRIAWLSEDERERAARFHFERDRLRFLGRQTFLRGLLGSYLGLEPGTLEFEAGPHGKPRLGARVGRDLRFNLSHSRNWVLVGVARGRELGVDVEAHQLRTELHAMALQVFAERERATFEALEPEARLPAFFRGWTRKEAALKATGEGFAREPRTLEVGLAPRDLGVLWRAGDEPVLTDYALADLLAPEGFSAAVCAEGASWSTRVASEWGRPVVLNAAGSAPPVEEDRAR